MVLEFSEKIQQTCPVTGAPSTESEMQQKILTLMESCGISKDTVNLKDNDVLELKDTSRLKLHRFMLEAEKLGLSWTFNKKTYIEFN